MTLDHAVALSLLENLRRVNLTERLKNDEELVELASSRLDEARAMRALEADLLARFHGAVPVGTEIPRAEAQP